MIPDAVMMVGGGEGGGGGWLRKRGGLDQKTVFFLLAGLATSRIILWENNVMIIFHFTT
jgi:hypothetical protein